MSWTVKATLPAIGSPSVPQHRPWVSEIKGPSLLTVPRAPIHGLSRPEPGVILCVFCP